MNKPLDEAALLGEIAQLRTRFPETQELYREVCVLLFFRYGLTPTANKLYQLVRKGSMSAPAEALSKFWEDLREKSRVRIEHPDLPEEIRAGAGELTATLWTLAQEKAADSLNVHREEARAAIMEAKNAQGNAETQRDATMKELERARSESQEMRSEIQALHQQLAAETATREMLEKQLIQAQKDIAGHQQALESARQYFAGEMEKLRSDSRLAEERYRASEKRALLEIDRERQVVAKLQQEMDMARRDTAAVLERQRAENTALQDQLGNLRQNLGLLEGRLQTIEEERDHMAQALKAAQADAGALMTRLTESEVNSAAWRLRAETAETVAQELRARLATVEKARRMKGRSPGSAV